jgi:hypothetical protein
MLIKLENFVISKFEINLKILMIHSFYNMYQVYNIGKDSPISGIEIFNLKKDYSSSNSENIYDIIVTTSKYILILIVYLAFILH